MIWNNLSDLQGVSKTEIPVHIDCLDESQFSGHPYINLPGRISGSSCFYSNDYFA